MKICDLALYSSETSSGVKTYIENKMRFVESLGKDVEHTVIIPAAHDYVETQGRSTVRGVRGIPTFYPGLQLGINIGRFADIVEKENPDLIEVNCQYTLPWAAFLATRRRRIPIVGVYHTAMPACARRFVSDSGLPGAGAVEKLTRFYEGILYRHFTLTIVLTEQMTAALNLNGIHRTQCLPCGVDTKTFTPGKYDSALKEKLGIKPEQKVLLYSGRLSPEKEVQILLDASKQLPGSKYVLLIAGDGPGAPSVRTFAAQHSGVQYLGHFDSPAELARIYAIADVAVVPSRYETFCMSAVEALACGAPVVGIEHCGVATIIDEQTGALAKAGDSNDLARKIANVAGWPNREEIRNRCRKVAERYSWERVFAGYFETYERLIAEDART